jgi:hypothetical protein
MIALLNNELTGVRNLRFVLFGWYELIEEDISVILCSDLTRFQSEAVVVES